MGRAHMKAKERAEQNDNDLRAWLGNTQGRRLFMRILTQANLWSASYVESPTGTAYNEGRRCVALGLLTEAQRVCPALYVLALREQLDALAAEQPVKATESAE